MVIMVWKSILSLTESQVEKIFKDRPSSGSIFPQQFAVRLYELYLPLYLPYNFPYNFSKPNRNQTHYWLEVSSQEEGTFMREL